MRTTYPTQAALHARYVITTSSRTHLPDGSEDNGLHPPTPVVALDTTALWAELATGALE